LSDILSRCIHIRKANIEEIAFYHTLDVIDTFLRQDKRHSTTIATTSNLSPESQREAPSVSSATLHLGRLLFFFSRHCFFFFVLPLTEHVELPDTFSLCKENPCQYTVLQYIMKHRQKYKGVLLTDLYKHLSGLFRKFFVVMNTIKNILNKFTKTRHLLL
jgi:hypothetical protein